MRVFVHDRLRKVPKTRDFAAFHVAPPDTGDVADEDRARIVVLHPAATHKRTTAETKATESAHLLLESRGNAQRLFKNMLVFLAADENDAEALRAAVREYLAWRSIQDERDQLNLDAQQRRQVSDSLATADDTVNLRVQTAYNWLIVPLQPEPLGRIGFQTNRISGDDNFYARAARKLRNDGLLITEWSPDILRMELDNTIWGEERGWEVGLKQLWEYLAQYVYLPRLFDREVLVEAVKDGVRRLDAPFGYATGVNEKGYHTGLVFRSTGSVYFDENSILVHPDHVAEPPVERPLAQPGLAEGRVGLDEAGVYEEEKPEEQPITRYYGRAQVDSMRVNKQMGLIVEEVIERLTSQVGCEVEITVEIQAVLPEGFDEATIRTVSENSRTLRFDHYGFEES